MSINKKWKSRIIILALIAVSVFIFFLAFRNDCRYNEVRRDEVSNNAGKDSVACIQRDIISLTLNKVSNQLDTIKNNQNMANGVVVRNMDSIKQSLNHIGRTERHILNTIK